MKQRLLWTLLATFLHAAAAGVDFGNPTATAQTDGAAEVLLPAPPERLTVRGRNIVNRRGEVVSLRGINFGGWLMMEIWIPSLELEWHDRLPQMARELGFEAEWRAADKEAGGFDDDKERIEDYLARLHQKLQDKIPADKFQAYLDRFHREPPVYAAQDMDALLRRRFGDAGAQEIWDAFHNTWITETDFQLARALGFNFVRIPFWYRWFEDDAAPYQYQEYGFRYLDRAVAWAREHGLYVMLDLHGAPGCQSPWDHTGELSRARFFAEPEFQRRAAALWQAIATRYRNNPTVFAYDLLNEPFSARDVQQWTAAHDRIYRAIRAVDPHTIIVMEDGYKLEEPAYRTRGFFPKPGPLGWTNLVYSIHFYSGWDPELTAGDPRFDHDQVLRDLLRVARREQQRHNVPIYLGEFSTMNDLPNDLAAMKRFMTRFNELGWHYSPWTWKYVNDTGRGSIWGVYQYNRPWTHTLNLHRDSRATILDAIGRLTMDNFSLHEGYGKILREVLAQPVRAAR
ncbi:MAG: glycoside hydrolase family 5 protein [Verrucomicrobiae bacterium]|nr:glycoside hydrolase family 5 protein [Verrucomicrobiae bacterium]